ncbi:MAG: S9 family peptidase [Chloroflexota bacterium]|nr:MAG: S9 family peptidase [Chloroflexota bacterium]UCF26816.1 MAG: S9 family peptidase [Chloroflexota bacterium]
MSILEKKPYTFEQFTAIRRYGWLGSISFSPDGSQIAYIVNTSGQYNLWRQETDGGYPHQLTTYQEHSVATVTWSPDGDWIAYSADYKGDEFYQLFAIPSDGGVPIQITDVDQVWHEAYNKAWSPDGHYLGYNANDRDREAMDVIVRNLETNEVSRLLAGEEYFEFANWAPASDRLLAVEYRSGTDFDIHLVDISSGKARLLTKHEGEAKFIAGPWKPDGSGFYLLTDFGREFVGLAYYDLGSDKWDWVETPEMDVEFVEGTDDGRYLALFLNDQGYSILHLRDLEAGKDIPLPTLPKGVVITSAFSANSRKLGVVLMTPTHCAEVYVFDLKDLTLKQITHSMLGGIDERDLVTPDLVSYPTFDGRGIPAWIFRPESASPTHKVPFILSIHGGPEWQERPIYIYAGMYQFWLSRGIGVLAPNIRGSTGYGKSYQKLIHRDWGGGELKDIEAAVHYLHGLDWVDKERIAIFGGSFGGFATLSAVTRLPDYWAAAVDIVGPSNLVTLIKTGPPHWQRIDERSIGHPEKDFDFLMSRSPVTYVDQVKTPLFVIQGANDQRVPKSESDQFVERLRERGVEVRYDVYEDEGHGFNKRENELKALKDASIFFEGYLLGKQE